MLKSVAAHVPEFYLFCYSAYSTASTLKLGDKIIMSQEGIQQGDPLGPLLFCLTVQPVLQAMSSELVISYMDDFTLGGTAGTVTSDVLRRHGLEHRLSS